MTICVKFWRGEWKKNEEEEWHFHPDENDVGKRVLIKADETYATLEAMVRREFSLRPSTPLVLTFRLPSWMLSPLGYKTPPTTITRTEDLCVLLNVQTSLSDLALIAIVGPRRVAEYEFLCRTRFSIGSTTYIVDGTQTEENRADYASEGVEGIHTSTGEIGIQVSTPRVLQVNPSQPNPPLPATPLFTFTQACQPGEPSGKRKVIKGDKETSSEASDIDGGF
ncbi:unnamed protein product [Brassica napus]|uniref:(rape) hypothetical protein n=1 Tax=Brassica napus TaxID=3708 RepID=A0A816VKX6_BRANA|nr:unnamed protein product [Brassica napus]